MLDTKDTKEKEPLPVRRGSGPETQEGTRGCAAAPAGGWRERAREGGEPAEDGDAGHVPRRRRGVCPANRSGAGGEGRRCSGKAVAGSGWPARWGAGAGGGRWVESRLSGQVRSGGAQVPEAEGPSQGVRILHQRRSDDRRYAEE